MKKTILIALSMLFMVAVSGNYAYAKQSKKSEPQQKEEVVKKPEAKKQNEKLSSKTAEINHKSGNYYQDGSKYYKKDGKGYIESLPPAGLKITNLEKGHKTFKYNKKDYYCLNGIIYIKSSKGGYEVVSPVKGMIVPELPWIDVTTMRIAGKVVYECAGFLYEAKGNEYIVTGKR